MEVNPYHKPESLLKLNPRGLVPTLEYKKKPLYESAVVCEFIEGDFLHNSLPKGRIQFKRNTDEYPDYGRKLRPDDVYQRAISRIWCDFVTSRIIPKYFRFLQHQEGQAPYSLVEARTDFLDSLKEFTKQMDQEGPFCLGKEPMVSSRTSSEVEKLLTGLLDG